MRTLNTSLLETAISEWRQIPEALQAFTIFLAAEVETVPVDELLPCLLREVGPACLTPFLHQVCEHIVQVASTYDLSERDHARWVMHLVRECIASYYGFGAEADPVVQEAIEAIAREPDLADHLAGLQ